MTEKIKSKYKPLVPAVEQAVRLLLCLGEKQNRNMTVTEICREIGIHKSKGYSILHTLIQYDFIVKNQQTKTYSLGPGIIPLAKNMNKNLDINIAAEKILQRLAIETGCTVLLGIVSSEQFFIIETYEVDRVFGITTRKNQALHISHGAHGKAIAAYLDKESLETLLEQDHLEFYGANNFFDIKEFKKELATIREKGFAVDNGSVTSGIKAISSPVFSPDKRIVAGIVLLGTFSEDEFEKYGKMVAVSSKEISNNLED